MVGNDSVNKATSYCVVVNIVASGKVFRLYKRNVFAFYYDRVEDYVYSRHFHVENWYFGYNVEREGRCVTVFSIALFVLVCNVVSI